tara:strand:- start:433 stop:717 length:285 start_codon:yes stop_codon:yes gene_type:complete
MSVVDDYNKAMGYLNKLRSIIQGGGSDVFSVGEVIHDFHKGREFVEEDTLATARAELALAAIDAETLSTVLLDLSKELEECPCMTQLALNVSTK